MILLDNGAPIDARVNLSRSPSARVCRPDVASVAIHEAGHAVVAASHRLPVARATILADTETFGCVWFAPQAWAEAPSEVHLLALLSGQAAQDVAVCRFGFPDLWLDGSDVIGARTILAAHLNATDWHAAPVEAGLAEWRQHVRHTVYHAWPWITRVAAALLERKVLTQSDIEELRR